MTDAAKDRLADEGFDPVYGARPLKRLIQRTIQNGLARRILEGEIGMGDTVRIDVTDDDFVFEKTASAEAQSPNGSRARSPATNPTD